MKKNTLLLFTLISSVTVVSAQEVISSQGSSYVNSSNSIDFTIGEVITNTESSVNITLTQGFHQSNWNFLGLQDFDHSYSASIFPNPTSDVLNIKASNFEKITYSLFDEQGKLIEQNLLSGEVTSIQVSQLALGSYSIKLSKENQSLKSFKLVKVN